MGQKYDIILFDVLANPKMRIIRESDGKQWDTTTESLSSAPTYANTAITLVEEAYINGMGVTIPQTLSAGNYYLAFYSAASPANTDATLKLLKIAWGGHSIIGEPIYLPTPLT